MKKVRFCPTCKTMTAQSIYRTVRKNKSEAFGWYCVAHHFCPQDNGGHWIKKELLAQYVDLNTLPTVSSEPTKTPCAHCGKPGTEDHHWAPQALFDDPNSWPISPLCDACHKLWHKIVTPQLVKGK